MPTLLCIGMGYTATHLAAMLKGTEWHVQGTSRHSGDIPYITGQPTTALRNAVCNATHILISVPPDEDGCPVLRDIETFLTINPERLAWLGYISSTSVYGDHKGQWVDETSECLWKKDERAGARYKAEAQWLAKCTRSRDDMFVHAFRFAGIYGPGRNALEQVRNGTAKRIDAPHHSFSRIHVEDAAAILFASMQQPHPSEIYNVADDMPCPSTEVTEYACELLGVTPPPLVALADAGLSPMGQSFYQSNKRVSNRKIKETLGVVLRYPTYREGLRALLETGTPIA